MASDERMGEMEQTKPLKAGNRKDAIITLGSLKWGVRYRTRRKARSLGLTFLECWDRLLSGMKVQRAQTGGDVAIWMSKMVGWR